MRSIGRKDKVFEILQDATPEPFRLTIDRGPGFLAGISLGPHSGLPRTRRAHRDAGALRGSLAAHPHGGPRHGAPVGAGNPARVRIPTPSGVLVPLTEPRRIHCTHRVTYRERLDAVHFIIQKVVPLD